MKEIDVLKAKSSMLSFLTKENATIDPELRNNENLVLGQQVKVIVKNSQSKYGIYTLHSDYQDGSDDNDMRMRASARARLDQSAAFDAYLVGEAVQQGKTLGWLQTNDEYGEFLEETDSIHSKIAICAPHGGMIENYSDEMARWMYDRLTGSHSKDASCWYCAGWQSAPVGAYNAWHITSADISRLSFDKLNQIGDRGFDYAVSFHGFGEDPIMVGGGAPAPLKNEIVSAIADVVGSNYDVEIAVSPYEGLNPDNFVNWLTDEGGGGIQIELPYGARRDYGQAIAEKLADVYSSKI
jgi:phage replication-related protein YjqB (UPF0714/DUF867 family)